MKIRTTYLFLMFFLLKNVLFAQEDPVSITQWRSHLSYESARYIAEDEQSVYYATQEAILRVFKADNSIEHINKVSGLNDMGVQTIEYASDLDILVIAYSNGNIDLVFKNGSVRNLSSIKDNKNIVGNKDINHIFCRDSSIYFSCSFGLVIYDLSINAFSQTTFTNSSVNACTKLNDTLFISMPQGIFAGILDGRNLLDFNQWIFQGRINGNTFSNYNSKQIINFDGTLFADMNDSLVCFVNGNWVHFNPIDQNNDTLDFWLGTSTNPNFISNFNFSLSYDRSTLVVCTQSSLFYTITKTNRVYENIYPNSWRIRDIVIDQSGIVWAADQGYLHTNFYQFRPNAPNSNNISDLHVDNQGVLWLSSSSYNTYTPFFNRNGFLKFDNGIWDIYNGFTRSEMDTFYDCVRIISNPENDKIYVGSFMRGLLELGREDNISIYDQYDGQSSLAPAIGDPNNTRVTGLAVDEDGNVWMSNSLTNTPLAVKKRNGDWKSIDISKLGEQQTEFLTIDRNGYVWIKQITGKVVVFDPGDINDDTDDQHIELGENNSVLPSNKINCIEADREGVVWVGTDQGITIFNCGSSIFDGSCQGNRPIISQDNFNGYLLEAEQINDIAYDGANRKWVATNNGLFLLSADGYDQLLYFTEENSPLFNNEVKHIAVDGVNGYVYIATSSGLQSFRSEATDGVKNMNRSDIVVFPHPVEPDYQGPIAIKNLAEDANVKITDSSGRLMYETTALGGQAIWYGTDYTGRRAQSGVYLVFVVNDDGSSSAVSKILFLN